MRKDNETRSSTFTEIKSITEGNRIKINGFNDIQKI